MLAGGSLSASKPNLPVRVGWVCSMPSPKFTNCIYEGVIYTALRFNDKIEQGDIWVDTHSPYPKFQKTNIGNFHRTMESICEGSIYDWSLCPWWAFRKGPAGPRRLPLNPIFSEPLPLP